jgi:hypothetical protein
MNTGKSRNFSSEKNENSSLVISSGNGSNKYNPWNYIGSAKQAADCQTTLDNIIYHITKTFDFGSDITFTLKKEKPYDMDQHKPKLKAIKAKSDNVKEVEYWLFKIKFKVDYDA